MDPRVRSGPRRSRHDRPSAKLSAAAAPATCARHCRPKPNSGTYVETTARAVFARYGFGEIRTPIFEDTQLFARGVGEETDIVSKEMYTWEDRARAQSEKRSP
jgi:hypothetical protein